MEGYEQTRTPDAIESNWHRLPPLKRWLRWTASGTIAATVYLVLLFAVENWRAERAWQSFHRDLNARGHLLEPTKPDELRLADEQNFLKAPLVSSWFNPDQIPSGNEPARLIPLTRPGDSELIGSWSEVKPADLKEWRQFYSRPIFAHVSSAAVVPTPGQGADEVVPLIVIDAVPLREAIRNLARQAKLEIQFDPLTLGVANSSDLRWQPNVTIRFENVTLRHAFNAVLDNYGLRLLDGKQAGVATITRALTAPSGWPHEMVDLDHDPLPGGADEVLPDLSMEGISGADAVRNAVRRVGINFQFDVGIPERLVQTDYSLTLSNVTPRRVLARVLADHGLALKALPQTTIYRVIRNRGTTRRQQDNTAAGVLESLGEFEEEFQALYAASERPGCQAEPPIRRKYTDWKAAPNYQPYSKLSEALVLHASAHLALGHSDIALRDATVLARMVEALRQRPELVGSMVRCVVSGRHQQVVWEGLAARRWSAEQLKMLERQMEPVDLLATCEMVLKSEEARLSDWMEHTPRGQMAKEMVMFSKGPALSASISLTDLPTHLFVLTCPRGWIRQNQLRAVQCYEDHFSLLNATKQRVHPGCEADLVASRDWNWWDHNPYEYLARTIMPLYSRAIEITARHQNGLNMARVACALERYRLRHERFPETLAALTPEFLRSLPHDITTGQPLSYLPTADGQFVLHSAGWNHEDPERNWGKVRPISGDWIWRYPAR